MVPAIDDVQRRARLARRHRLTPGCRAEDVPAAATSVVALHATDLTSVHLAAWARGDGIHRPDVERALYDTRSVVVQMAMRRTLFAVPADALAVVVHGAGRRVAEAQSRALVRDVERHGVHVDGAGWLAATSADVVGFLSERPPATWAELRTAVPALASTVIYGAGKRWGGDAPLGPRVLTALSARGDIVRAGNTGTWMNPRPTWTTMAAWLGAPLPPMEPADARRALVARWLRSFGPGTAHDIVWWLGGTAGHVRAALAELEAVEVTLDHGAVGYVLPDDLAPEEPIDPWAALLPTLDPTTMGWHERDWYLGAHRAALFDTAGNGGTTAWWDGRIVGGWDQADDGRVRVHLLEDVAPAGARALDDEADRLTAWLDGARPGSRWRAPMFRTG